MEEGHILADLNYFIVKKKTDDYVIFSDITNQRDWALPASQVNIALSSAWSADEVRETRTVCRTDAVEKLLSAGVRPFTVVFVKADRGERTLRGKLINEECSMGRSHVLDLDKVLESGENSAIRQVDHRTIKSLILDGVQYNVRDN